MKKLLGIFLFFVITEATWAQQIINQGLTIAAQQSSDGKQYKTVNGRHVPYASSTDYLTRIVLTRRHVGQIGYVANGATIEVWQFVGGILDVHFQKIVSGSGGGVTVVSYGKNATRDSTFLLLSNGVRYAARDSIGAGFPCTGKVGGFVSYDSLLIFSVSAAPFYCIDGKVYSSSSGSITLDPAHPTLSRQDVIALDTNGLIVKITGVPAIDPAVPQINPGSQYYLTSVLIGPGETTPTTPTGPPPLNVILWNENVGAPTEYVGSANGLTVNFDYTAAPANIYAPVKSTDVGAWTVGDIITYTGTAYSTTADPVLRFFIKNKAAVAAASNIGVQLMSGGVARTATLNLGAANGYSKSNIISFQNITIPLSNFTFSQLTPTIDGIRFTTLGSGTGFYLDYITLNTGISNTGPGNFMTDVFKKPGTDSVFKTINNVNSFAFKDAGNTNTNVGPGFRLAVPNTNQIKTLVPGTNITIDSTSTPNAIRISAAGSSSTINIFNDSTLIICSNGTNLCDTVKLTTVGAIQTVTILNDSTLQVCGSLFVCDTLFIPQGNLNSSNKYWNLTGNSITNSSTNFLGTLNSASLRFRTNNIEGVVIDSLGDVGIGTNRPEAHFHLVENGRSLRGIVVELNNNETWSAGVQYRKSRGSYASPLTILNGDYIGGMAFSSFVNGMYKNRMLVGGRSIGTVTSVSSPIDFYIGMDSLGVAFDEPYSSNSVKLVLKSYGTLGLGNMNVNPSRSAVLDMHDKTRGYLPPRMTTTQRNAIAAPADGLHIYNLTTKVQNWYDSTNDVWLAPSIGSGSTNSNVGAGFRLVIPNTNNVKTLFAGTNITMDSTTNANGITINSTAAGSPNSNVGTSYRLAIPNTNNIKTVTAGTNITIDSTTNANELIINAGGASTVIQNHTTGATVTVGNNTTWLVVNPATALGSLTVTLPAAPTNGQLVGISFGGTITLTGETVVSSFSVNPNGGQTMAGTGLYGIVETEDHVAYRYNSSLAKWYRN